MTKWIYIRKDEVRMVFDNRKEAVKYLKALLKQTLKDFEKQDKIDEYDYNINIPEQSFRELEERSASLSLL